MSQLQIGDKFVAAHATTSGDVTVGKEYTIAGEDQDGDVYFIDDAGEQNFAMCQGLSDAPGQLYLS